MKTVHIEAKPQGNPEHVQVLQGALVGRQPTWLNPAAASVLTGLPLDASEYALLQLSSQLPSELRVSDDGQIEARFTAVPEPNLGLVATALRALRRWWQQNSAPAAVVLTMLLMTPVMAVGIHGGELMHESGGPIEPLGVMLRLVWSLIALPWALMLLTLMFPWLFVVAGVVVFLKEPSSGAFIASALVCYIGAKFGWKSARALSTSMSAKKDRRFFVGFWRHIRGFVAGPPLPRVDRLADERRLTAFIADSKGVVTTGDLVGLFGWMPDEAQSQLVRIMLDYGGDVTVTDDGSILWVFPSFAAGRPPEMTAPEMTAPEMTAPEMTDDDDATPDLVEPVPPTRFFGAPWWFVIATLLLVTPLFLVFGLVSPSEAFPNPMDEIHWGISKELFEGLFALTGLWPLALLSVFLVLRIPGFTRRILRDADRRHIVDWVRIACVAPHGTWHRVAKADHAILARLGGHIDIERGTDALGEVYVDFPEFARDRKAAATVRAQGVLTPTF
jgi:hypothetical protein